VTCIVALRQCIVCVCVTHFLILFFFCFVYSYHLPKVLYDDLELKKYDVFGRLGIKLLPEDSMPPADSKVTAAGGKCW